MQMGSATIEHAVYGKIGSPYLLHWGAQIGSLKRICAPVFGFNDKNTRGPQQQMINLN
jgi:hypothetical protein